MKRLLSLILSLIILLSVFCCCAAGGYESVPETGSQNSPASGAKPLVVFYPEYTVDSDASDRIFRAASRIFTETYGIEVELYPSPTFDEALTAHRSGDYDYVPNFNQKLFAEMMAGRGPDVFLMGTMFNEWFWKDVYKRIESGAFCDLNPFIENDKEFDLADYNVSVMDSGLFRGKRYILPLSYSMPFVLVSENKLTEYGFKADDYSTYERFISSWEKLHNSGIRLTTGPSAWFMLANLGGWLDECVDFETGRADLELFSFERVIKLSADDVLIENGVYDLPLQEFIDQERDIEAIESANKSGLFNALALHGLGGNGGLIMSYKKLDAEDALVLPIPNFYGDVPARVVDCCMISEVSENKETAWNFIKIILSEEFQKAWWKNSMSHGAPIIDEFVDGYIDVVISDWVPDYKDTDADMDLKLRNAAKDLYHSCDSAFIPQTRGYLLYEKMVYYIYNVPGLPEYDPKNSDFERLKSEAANYFNIYLSE